MSSNSSVVTRKGQITIPAEIRRELDIKEGDQIIFYRQSGSVEILTAAEFVRRTAGSLPLKPGVKPATIAQLKEAAAQGWVEGAIKDMNQ